MNPKPKPVPEMNPEEYFEYLMGLSREEFMQIVAHDVRKVASVAHGYISLMQLDIDEGSVENDNLAMYIKEMQAMFEKAYTYLNAAEEAYYRREISP